MRIFYFSGTGNARRVAEWVTNAATAKGTATDAIDIAKMEVRNIKPEAGEMLGIISPTHGFNFPPIVLNFIFRFPRSKYGNKIFLINTRAGMKVSRFFMPGLSGIALLLSALVLFLKGYRVTGMRSIDLPSNWISIHPGLREKVVNSMFEHYKQLTFKFTEKMLGGKKVYRALYDLPQDLLISPIAVGYYVLGRFILAKSFYASSACDNCGLCSRQCPVKAIIQVGNKPFWSYRCESCMRCMNNCPKRAIETAHGYVFGVLVLINMVIAAAVYTYIENNSEMKSLIIIKDNFWVNQIFQMSLTFIVFILSYRIIHFLRRFKLFAWAVEYTSLTKLKRWRRYKAPKESK